MRKETKEIIYMVLDFLESFSRTSREDSNLIYVNKSILEDVKNDLFNLLNQTGKSKRYGTEDKKTELIGILPSVLIDKNKFPTNESIVKLAEKSLGLKISNWRKKSRNEIIGILVAKIAEKDVSELDIFIEAWKEFTEQKRIRKEHTHEDFVDLWLKFFEHYRKGER